MKITEPEKKGLTTASTDIILSVKTTMDEIVLKIGPEVESIVSSRASGEIVIQFHEGRLQRGKAVLTKHF